MLARRPAHAPPSPIAARHNSALPGPASLLERNPLSPKGWKKRDSEGVGLSIVTNLESGGGERRGMLFVGASTGPIAIRSARAAEMGCGGKLSAAGAGEFPLADFLSCCYLCKKRLHGKDIYMYRGEKAFCSIECRYQQIVSDECLEKWGSEVLRRPDVSSSPCSGDGGGVRGDRLFFTGITAAY